jgi:hypothetical protein
MEIALTGSAVLNQAALADRTAEPTDSAATGAGPRAFVAFLGWVRNRPEMCERSTLNALRQVSKVGDDYGTAASCRIIERSIYQAMRVVAAKPDDVLTGAEKNYLMLEQAAVGQAWRSRSWGPLQPLVETAREQLACQMLLVKDAEGVTTLEDWNRVCDRIAGKSGQMGLPQGNQARPLYALGVSITKLPLSERSQAMQRFGDVVEGLPLQHRYGLLGLSRATLHHPERFHEWQTQAVNGPIRREVSTGSARYSYDERSAIAEKYGINTARKQIELNLIFFRTGRAPAAEALMKGGSCIEIVKAFDLRHAEAQFSLELATLGGNVTLPLAPAKDAIKQGMAKDEVARRFGIQSKSGLSLLDKLHSTKGAEKLNHGRGIALSACDTEEDRAIALAS